MVVTEKTAELNRNSMEYTALFSKLKSNDSELTPEEETQARFYLEIQAYTLST